MKIARLLLITFFILGGFAVAKSGVAVIDAHRQLVIDRQLAIAAQARSDWYEGTVAMSFERSVMQVALSLEDPIPPAFMALINEQRAQSDALLEGALDAISTLQTFDNAPRFLAEVTEARAGIDALREEADRTLNVPASQRDAALARALPYELKALIERLYATASLLVLADGASRTEEMKLSRIQALAWEVREYGGRARTFYAIASLKGVPIPLRDFGEAQIDTSRAEAAWNQLRLATDAYPIPASLMADIEQADTLFAQEYLTALDRMNRAMEEMRSGQRVEIPFSFDAFFALSNAGLDSVAALAPAAGEHIQLYWAEALRESRLSRMWSAIGMLLLALLIAATLWIMHRKVIRPIEAATTALTHIANGDIDRQFRQTQRNLDEMKIMWDALEKLAFSLRATREREAADRLAEIKAKEGIMGELTVAFSKMSKGDLTHEIKTDYGEGYRALVADFNTTVQKLREAIAAVAHNSSALTNRSEAVSSAILDLSSRTEKQTKMVAETAARLNELLNVLRKTKENMRQSSHTATDAAERSVNGSSVVRRAIGTMDLIKSTSAKINGFSSVIDDIAFQTGILSLNAGVEAARAGKAGKGFAIVAQEVRGLANRASASAQQIKELVDESEKIISNGVEEVSRTGASLGEITKLVKTVRENVQGVDEAAQVQTEMIEHIGATMSEIDEMTKKNAAMVDETTCISEALRDTSQRLKTAVGHFTLEITESTSQLHVSNQPVAA